MYSPWKASAEDAELLAVSSRASDLRAVHVGIVDESHVVPPLHSPAQPARLVAGTPSSTGSGRPVFSIVASSLVASTRWLELALPLVVASPFSARTRLVLTRAGVFLKEDLYI